MSGPLADLRVIDASTVLAGPACARYLADFGADVIKVERPDGGDTLRGLGWRDPRDGVTLFWKLNARNKRTITLDLKDTADHACFVLVPRRARAHRELSSGHTRATRPVARGAPRGEPRTRHRAGHRFRAGRAVPEPAGIRVDRRSDERIRRDRRRARRGPLLPPIALTDEVTGLVAAFAAMVALHSGVGQVVDVNLLESLFQLMGPLIGAYRMFGYVQPRLGSGIPYTVPRGTYQCSDGCGSRCRHPRSRSPHASWRCGRGRRSSVRDVRRSCQPP